MTSTAAPAKQSIKIHANAIIADKASLTGTHEIEIGDGSMVHPYAKLKADGGKIIVGAYCTIAEAAVIGLSSGKGDIIIEDYVQIESGAVVMASRVGQCSRIGIHSIARAGSSIGKGCTLPPKIILEADQQLEDFSTLLADKRVRQDKTAVSQDTLIETRRQQQIAEVAVLRKLIPNTASKYATS